MLETTLLLVHGTGTRKVGYESMAAQVARQLAKIAPRLVLRPCLWGDAFGARLHHGGDSIPLYTGDGSGRLQSDDALARWELLAADPLFELRELGAYRTGNIGSPHTRDKRQALLFGVEALRTATTPLALVSKRVPHGNWQMAVDKVRADLAFTSAVDASRPDTGLRRAIARALVATLQRDLLDDGLLPLPATTRDALVDSCVDELGGLDAGLVGDAFKSVVSGLAMRWATRRARRERNALFDAASPIAGDILLYQSRGEPIRRFISERIAECPGNVVVLAHSLGGIACIDLMVLEAQPKVVLLVTVGSQAPFLYEIGALLSLMPKQQLPAHFPRRWLNVYDPNDLLSYRAEPLFSPVAVDLCVTSEQPFPASHSAYWDSEELWARLLVELTALPDCPAPA